jgi:hypothetical protein
MSPEVVAAIIAASVSFLTLIGSLAERQWRSASHPSAAGLRTSGTPLRTLIEHAADLRPEPPDSGTATRAEVPH